MAQGARNGRETAYPFKHPELYSRFIYKSNTNGPNVIEWMGAINAVAELNGNGACHLENAMTMSNLQDVFDTLGLCFEVTVWYCFASSARIHLT